MSSSAPPGREFLALRPRGDVTAVDRLGQQVGERLVVNGLRRGHSVRHDGALAMRLAITARLQPR